MKKIGENVIEEAGKKGVSKVVDLLVDRYIIPKLEGVVNSPQDILDLEEQFKIYLNKRYNIDKYINTIVFQNVNKTVDELYIPLTIIQNGKRNKIVLNKTMKNIFNTPIKYLIMDTAGTGKSTLVKFLSTFCVENEWGIPFIVELRRIEKNQSIENFILDDVKLTCKKVSYADIKDLIRRGDFIFFLDGYDEILEENKKEITKEIRNFVTASDNNCFIITSREDDCLNEFNDFSKFHIQELEKHEAYELIRKYDNYDETSENLINEIEKDENYSALREFLGNPLMVSLLYLTYQFKGVLQYKKSIFYRQVYDALYDRHDQTKGVGKVHEKKSKLDIEDFRKILCAMGFLSVKQGKVEFTKDEIIQLIIESKNVFSNITTNECDYLNDILHAVPLFKEEGVNFKWVHKSFAEYFASVFICQEFKECEKSIFNSILEVDNNQRFYNILDFCYDIDYKAVVDYIICPILEEFISFCESGNKNSNHNAFAELEDFYQFIDNIYLIKFDDKPRPKDRDSLKDYLDVVQILRDNDINTFSYLSYVSRNENVIMAVQRRSKYEIVKLLYRKKIDIFKSVSVKDYPMKFLRELKKEKIYNILSEGKDQSEFFTDYREQILSYIFHHSFDFDGNVLDVEKCKQKLKQIKSEQNKISDSFFQLV